jgi:hypothetical protein
VVEAEFSTNIYTTPSGVRVRVDTVPCGWLTNTGDRCRLWKQRIYLSYSDPSKIVRHSASIVCEHQKDNPGVWWDENMIVTLFDRLHVGKSFRDIDAELRTTFPAVAFPPPIIKRKSDGSYKEFDCPAKKKYEDIKCNKVTIDVWSHSVQRNDANNSIVWSQRGFFM